MKKILKILLTDDNQEQVNFMKEIIQKNSLDEKKKENMPISFEKYLTFLK